MRLIKILGLETVLLTIGGGIYMREYEPSWVDVNNVTLQLPRLGRSFSGLRLVQISDLHFGGWMTSESLNDIVRMIGEQSPDLVTITGDFVVGHTRSQHELDKLDDLAAALKPLSERFPVFAVLGNHDIWLSRNSVLKALYRAGITTLSNVSHTIKRGSDKLHIAGVDDVMERFDRMDRVQFRLPEDGCAILLAHEPDFADVSAATGRFDLQLSGHSHGGQVVLPLIGPPILPYLAHKYPSGLYQVMNMYQFTNRGIGMTPPYVRFNCRPEITVFTLESA